MVTTIYHYITIDVNPGINLNDVGMDQYLWIPFLGGWTSIYQLFWCSPGVQGFDTLPYYHYNLSYVLQPSNKNILSYTRSEYIEYIIEPLLGGAEGAIKTTQIGFPILKRMDKPVGKYFSKYSPYKTHIKNIVYWLIFKDMLESVLRIGNICRDVLGHNIWWTWLPNTETLLRTAWLLRVTLGPWVKILWNPTWRSAEVSPRRGHHAGGVAVHATTDLIGVFPIDFCTGLLDQNHQSHRKVGMLNQCAKQNAEPGPWCSEICGRGGPVTGIPWKVIIHHSHYLNLNRIISRNWTLLVVKTCLQVFRTPILHPTSKEHLCPLVVPIFDLGLYHVMACYDSS